MNSEQASCGPNHPSPSSVYWDYAMTIRLEEIVYLHCHQQVDSGGTVVLLSQDGIQRPPFRFPKGGHLLQFLSCLENGLLPHGQLDPPLWSQRGKGKVFPKLRKRSPQGSAESTSSYKEDNESTDYVFRTIYPGMRSEFGKLPHLWAPWIQLLADHENDSRCLELEDKWSGLWGQQGDQKPGRFNEGPRSELASSSGLGWLSPGLTLSLPWQVDEQIHACYAQTMAEWLGCEAIVRQRERESHAAALAKCSSGASLDGHLHRMMHRDSTISNESSQSCSSGHQHVRLQSDSSSSTQVFESVDEVEQVEAEGRLEEKQPKIPNGNLVNGTCSPDSGHPSSHNFSSGLSEHSEPSLSTEDSVMDAQRNASLALRPGDSSVEDGQSSEATTSRDEAPREELAVQDSLESDLLANESMDEFMSLTSSMDVAMPEKEGAAMEGWGGGEVEKHSQVDSEDNLSEEPEMESLFPALASLAVATSANNEASPVSSSGVTYSPELLDLYTVNLHRIEKDVQRCDRNYWYFTPANLEKLR
ncbi:small G protein signaling modulator 1, partial [Ailuropoda melanoleuca]|uniref:small G protein signaling modulator 1 n=1 Tax=Ailuropoda melanoleuca TaxID=9646 RepID=UPI0014942829